MDNLEIIFSEDLGYNGPWVLTSILTKTRLKYGCIGPWKETQFSTHFDSYSLECHYKKRLPNLIDFCATQLMHSRASSLDCERILNWLADKENSKSLESIQKIFINREDFLHLNEKEIVILGEFVERMLDASDEENNRVLFGVGIAKIFKWLSVWAPLHVPMIDSYVYIAMTGSKFSYASPKIIHCLKQFKGMFEEHYSRLDKIGKHVAKELKIHEIPSIPAIRVLDGAIWFDWTCENDKNRRELFEPFIDYSTNEDCYRAKPGI